MNTASTPIESLALAVIADPEACQICGVEYAAPICRDCNEARWEGVHVNHSASAEDRR